MVIERTYLNIVKAKYDKPTANIILNGEKLKAFPLKSGTRQGCVLSPLFFNIFLEILISYSNQRRKRNNRKPDRKRSKALTFCRWHDMHTENPKDSSRKLLELISEFSKVSGCKINTEKWIAFLYTNNEKSEREIKESIPFTTATERITYIRRQKNYTKKIIR